jgi:hypothetical protein
VRARRSLWIIALGLGLALTVALLTALNPSLEVAHAWPMPTPGDTRPPGPAFVKPGGTGGWCLQDDPCGSIQYAIDECEPGNGDTIYVAGGTYTGTGSAVITVTKSITLYGGWNGTTTTPVVRDPDTYATILDAENGRRVVYITGTVAPILEGFTLQRGNASGLGGDPVLSNYGFGGAVYANNANLVISNCRILSSTAGFGGGVALYYGAPTVGNSVVLSNTASQSATGQLRGVGGGMFLYGSPATIVGNVVMNNVAAGDHLIYDGGGGLYLDGSQAVIRSNTIQSNSGRYRGGGLYIYQSVATMHDNAILNNNATSYGGGVYMVESPTDLEANTILDNGASQYGGGLLVGGCAPFTLTNNIIARNSAQTGPALYVARYKETPWSTEYPSQGTLLHNTFAENDSPLVPWMIHVDLSTNLALTNTIIDKPGGITVTTGSSVTLDTTLWNPSLLLQPELTVSGTGSVISSTNYYSELGVISSTFHLGANSPAIDQGANAGVTTDIDGESRPEGAGYDIGADEFYQQQWPIYLPLVLRDY